MAATRPRSQIFTATGVASQLTPKRGEKAFLKMQMVRYGARYVVVVAWKKISTEAERPRGREARRAKEFSKGGGGLIDQDGPAAVEGESMCEYILCSILHAIRAVCRKIICCRKAPPFCGSFAANAAIIRPKIPLPVPVPLCAQNIQNGASRRSGTPPSVQPELEPELKATTSSRSGKCPYRV